MVATPGRNSVIRPVVQGLRSNTTVVVELPHFSSRQPRWEAATMPTACRVTLSLNLDDGHRCQLLSAVQLQRLSVLPRFPTPEAEVTVMKNVRTHPRIWSDTCTPSGGTVAISFGAIRDVAVYSSRPASHRGRFMPASRRLKLKVTLGYRRAGLSSR